MILDTVKQMIGKPMNAILKRVDEPMEKLFWNLAIIIIWVFLNWLLFKLEGDSEQQLSFGDALYYTVTTHFTIGFGDITPIGPLTRTIYYFHIFLVWFINMVPAGLTVFEDLKTVKKDVKPFAGQQKLERQSKFKSLSELPKGRRGSIIKSKSAKITPIAGQKYTI